MPKSIWPKPNGYGPSSLPNRQVPVDMRAQRIHSIRPRRRGIGDDVEIISSISELENGPQSLPLDAMPVDMLPRMIEEFIRMPDGSVVPTGGPGSGLSLTDELLRKISIDTGIMSSTLVLSRGLIGRTVTVTTTPQQIIDAQFLRGYILLNPNELAGATAAGTLLASASRGAATADLTGNSASLGVANYLEGHFFVSYGTFSGGASLDVILQAFDPTTSAWFDVQNLVSAVTATGTQYSYVGGLGVATDLRVRWAITAGDVVFSVGYVLKNGLAGTSSGISQTIYIGGPGVTTTSGFPLLNGQSQRFFLKENVELWAVAAASLPLKIFEL